MVWYGICFDCCGYLFCVKRDKICCWNVVCNCNGLNGCVKSDVVLMYKFGIVDYNGVWLLYCLNVVDDML